MTKIEVWKFGTNIIWYRYAYYKWEEYLTPLDGAQSQEEKEFYTQIYNYLLAKRQKEVIANEHY